MNSPQMENSTRVVIGNCPDCGVVVCAATKAGEVWPLLDCHNCAWKGPTSELWNHHYFESTSRLALASEAPQPCPQGRYPFSQ